MISANGRVARRQRLTLADGQVLQAAFAAAASIPPMTTPVHAHFSDSWWNDSEVEERRHGGLGLWALIVLLTLAPGVGVFLTVFLD